MSRIIPMHLISVEVLPSSKIFQNIQYSVNWSHVIGILYQNATTLTQCCHRVSVEFNTQRMNGKDTQFMMTFVR